MVQVDYFLMVFHIYYYAANLGIWTVSNNQPNKGSSQEDDSRMLNVDS